MLGPAPLVVSTQDGARQPVFRAARPEWVADVLAAAYGHRFDAALPRRLAQLDGIAKALGEGRLAEAAIRAVHLGLPVLTAEAAARLTLLCKYDLASRAFPLDRQLALSGASSSQSEVIAASAKKFDPAQPRVPKGTPDGGQWMSSGTAGASPVVPAQEIIIPSRVPLFLEDPPKTPGVPRTPGTPGEPATPRLKEPIQGLSGKEAADDPPSWARGERPYVGEKGRDFAARLLDEKYGPGNYPKGGKSEYSRLQKWADRHFRDPKAMAPPDDAL